MSVAQQPSGDSFAAVWPVVADTEGWLAESQGEAPFEAAAPVPSGQAFVKIGSHHGESTVVLARVKAPGVNLLAVDPFDDPAWGGGPEALQRFEANLDAAGVKDEVRHFAGTSLEAAVVLGGGGVLAFGADRVGPRAAPTVSSARAAS